MSVWSSYGTDKSLENEGRWVNFRLDEEGSGEPIQIKVRSSRTVRADAIRSRYFAKHRHVINASQTIPPDIMEGANIEMCKRWIVADWRNVKEDDGTDIPCTPEQIERVMTALRGLRDDVMEVAGIDLTFKTAGADELGNSSRPTSALASAGAETPSPSPSKPLNGD